ncbi:ligand-binding SRPBCC domain-containing protein [Chitinophaga niastensis]|uniref:Ligand-binding SRPBCC domain-containing protein n=1 Tax=Chitinophaga niastensis TaxID=536980 RepID=A0A2P8HSG8_CHINA|nr:SRPBCC family protein [Chitinophaga niastensis]PSL49142.1 ligand-binding SRPBCC domain-containing protein [Chitinophaga niastensis]
MASVYLLQRTQLISASLEEVWDYFSAPGNLTNITPAHMRFRVTSPPVEGQVYPGQIITYKVSPVAGIPLEWMTEITHVEYLVYFVDEQRVGPYSIWHHQHHFEAVAGGVKMTDTVHYRLPFGWLGKLAHGLFVKRQLEALFAYRNEAVKKQFTPSTAAQ